MREMEHEHFAKQTLSGEVLDVGGGRNAGYLKKVKGTFTVTAMNFGDAVECDILHDLEVFPYPIKDNAYDVVVSNNTLEHIYHARELVCEVARTLKPGGMFVFSVPFLYPYHPSPGDFWRYTRESLHTMLTSAGFVSIDITPLGTGVFTVNMNNLERLLPGALQNITYYMRPFVGWCDHVLYVVANKMGKKYVRENYALGFWVTACRASQT